MGVVGKHIIAQCYDVKDIPEEELLRAVLNAVNLANMHLISIDSWNVSGDKGGVSVIAVVSESHIAVHTWRNYNYATIDVYTCGEESDPWIAYKYLSGVLGGKCVESYVDRSSG